jgi:hypothetical protein
MIGAPDVGVWVFSTTMRYGDGDAPENSTYKGGAVIGTFSAADNETGEMVDFVQVVEFYRGRPHYHNFRVDDVECGMSGPYPNLRALRDLSRRLNDDMYRHHSNNHLAALLVLSHVEGVVA